MNEDYSYFQDKEFRNSLAAYEHMQKGGEMVELDAETLTDIAEYYAMNQRDDEATRCIKYALSFYPDSVDPQIFLARQQMFFGHQKEAWRICNAISDQDDREVLFLRAELKFHDTQDRSAFEPLLHEYVSMRAANDEEAPDFLYDIVALIKDYDYLQMALVWVKQLRQDYPDYLQAIALQAEILNGKQQYQDAAKLLESNIERMPYDTHAWLQLAEAYLWLGNFKDALEATDYVLAINEDDAEALLMRANILFEDGQTGMAHKYYTHFLRYFPRDTKTLYLDGQCLTELEDYEKATEQFKKASVQADEYMRGYVFSYLAYCYYKLHDEEQYLLNAKKAEAEPFNCLSELLPERFPPQPPTEESSDLPF